jgi:excisionase family DNA binding protein
LTIKELSGYLKMSRSKLYQMAQKGELPTSKIGTQWRFDRDRIDDCMKSLRQTTTQKASVNDG